MSYDYYNLIVKGEMFVEFFINKNEREDGKVFIIRDR